MLRVFFVIARLVLKQNMIGGIKLYPMKNIISKKMPQATRFGAVPLFERHVMRHYAVLRVARQYSRANSPL